MDKEILQLIIAELKRSISEADKIKLNAWVEEKDTHKTEYQKIIAVWNQTGNIEHLINIDHQKDWLQVKDKITTKLNINLRYWAVAASVALLFSVFTTVDYLKINSPISEVDSLNNEYPKKIILADGTNVILSFNSKLNIHNDFGKKNRTVELIGEAYFRVTKNANLPFEVLTEHSRTKVLGTAFNIKSTSNSTNIQVEHGKVSFTGIEEKLILEKKMAAQSDKNGLISLVVYDENRYAWRTGVLKFKDESLLNVINTLEDYYDIDIDISEGLSNYRLTATFNNLRIEQLLAEISLIHHLSYQKTKKGYVITKRQ